VEAVVREVVSEFGRLTIFVANAGFLRCAPILETAAEDLERHFGVNVCGVLFGIQAAGRAMIEQGTGGRIVVITSRKSQRTAPGFAAYSSSKAAARVIVETAALELAQYGITVNAVAPGTIETDLNRSLLQDPIMREHLTGSTPVNRMGTVRDVANVVTFLASAEASFINGCTIPVDGGAHLV
jgi:NAD(P)-dependent dehydrogenase (short-subunit alcohol dehydrogenase family)